MQVKVLPQALLLGKHVHHMQLEHEFTLTGEQKKKGKRKGGEGGASPPFEKSPNAAFTVSQQWQ